MRRSPSVLPASSRVSMTPSETTTSQSPAVNGADPMPMTPDTFDAHVRKEIELNRELVKAAGIKVN